MRAIVRRSGSSPEIRHFLFGWVAPTLLVLLIVVLPLITGSEILYQRDILNTHYEMKWAQAQAMRQGELPLIDLQRAGGQVHLGNPNTVPLYPTNLLYLVAETLWALSAHFWIHLLVAPFAGFWLGRALGMRREAAWTVGAVYATSGFFLSTLNLYNLVPAVALAPAFLAAALELASPAHRKRGFIAGSVLWCLMILGGDPVTAALTLVGVVAVVAVRQRLRYPWLAATAAIALGTALAAPQWVEFMRILDFTYRGFWGFGADLATTGGWRPLDALEFLVPFPFGYPNLNYWGQHLHAGQVPLFFTYYPGVLVIALMLVARRDGNRIWGWAWALVAFGLFFALGETNPLVVGLSKLPGASLLRIPSKFWSLVTLGASVLCGLALASLFGVEGRRRMTRALGLLALVFAAVWLVMSFLPDLTAAWMADLFPESTTPAVAAAERTRWAGACFLSLLLLVVYLLCMRTARWKVGAGLAALILIHVATQLFFLRAVLETDRREPYLERPALLDAIPSGSRVVYAEKRDLFGPTTIPLAAYPDVRLLWRERQMHQDLAPWSGVHGGLRYEFNLSPEGLDSFLTRAVAQSLTQFDSDAKRIRVLEASGVDYVIIRRPFDASVTGGADLALERPTAGGTLYVYRLTDSALPVQLVGRGRGSRHLNEALALMMDPGFDPREIAVLAGAHEPMEGAGGSARILVEHSDRMTIETASQDPGVLVVQRTHMPVYRAAIDGVPADLYAANLHRLGVKVPAGNHRVEIWFDRRPFYWSLALVAMALGVLGWTWRRGLPSWVQTGAATR